MPDRHTQTRPRPWVWFVLAGLFLGLSAWGLGLARSQDAAKTTLWWFALGGGLLALARQLSGLAAARIWLLLCLVFGLDIAVQGVIRGFFGALPQPGVIAEALANTTPSESWGFLMGQRGPIAFSTFYWVLWWAIGLLGSRAWRTAPAPSSSRKRWGLLAALLAFAGLLHANPSMLGHEPFLRWGVVYMRHQQARQEMQNLVAEREALWTQREQWQARIEDSAPSTVIVFIGESGNRMNWGLYGYPRDTTAPLAQAFQALGGQVLLFTRARSTQAFTLPSLRLALTPADETQPGLWQGTPDFVLLARAAGYHVRWLSNQPGQDGWLASLARGADEYVFINSGNWRDSSTEDDDLVPVLRQKLQGQPPAHELIVVHLLGQHFHYALRCGKQPGPFARITDDAVMQAMQAQGRSAGIRQARNDYDDATYCGARSVAQLLQTVAQARADRPVRALYFSDHGQEVGHQRDFAGHSERDESGYTVPLWVWRNALARPLDGRQLNAPIRLDTLDQALHHLLGIHSRWYDPRLDFLSSQYAPDASVRSNADGRGPRSAVSRLESAQLETGAAARPVSAADLRAMPPGNRPDQ